MTFFKKLALSYLSLAKIFKCIIQSVSLGKSTHLSIWQNGDSIRNNSVASRKMYTFSFHLSEQK